MKKSKASFILNVELVQLSVLAEKSNKLCDILIQNYFDKDEFTQRIEFKRYYAIALILEDYVRLLKKESAKIENMANKRYPKIKKKENL